MFCMTISATTETGEPIAVPCRMFSATLIRINLKTHLSFTGFGQKRIKIFLSTLIRTKLENATLPEKSYKIIVTSAVSKCSVFKMFSVVVFV